MAARDASRPSSKLQNKLDHRNDFTETKGMATAIRRSCARIQEAAQETEESWKEG
jgi:hypothetical protein